MTFHRPWVCLGARLAAMAITALLCACAGERNPSRAPSFSLAVAESIAMRYVEHDTAGNWRAADSLVLPCEGDQARDYVAVTRRVRWLAPRTHAGTITLTALYDLVGSASSYDEKQTGPQNWRFKAEPGVDTSFLDIVADSTGRVGIVCGSFSDNHQMVSSMASIVRRFDDSSRALWNRALSEH